MYWVFRTFTSGHQSWIEVGFYSPDGVWDAPLKAGSEDEAIALVAKLNGGQN